MRGEEYGRGKVSNDPKTLIFFCSELDIRAVVRAVQQRHARQARVRRVDAVAVVVRDKVLHGAPRPVGKVGRRVRARQRVVHEELRATADGAVDRGEFAEHGVAAVVAVEEEERQRVRGVLVHAVPQRGRVHDRVVGVQLDLAGEAAQECAALRARLLGVRHVGRQVVRVDVVVQAKVAAYLVPRARRDAEVRAPLEHDGGRQEAHGARHECLLRDRQRVHAEQRREHRGDRDGDLVLVRGERADARPVRAARARRALLGKRGEAALGELGRVQPGHAHAAHRVVDVVAHQAVHEREVHECDDAADEDGEADEGAQVAMHQRVYRVETGRVHPAHVGCLRVWV